MLESLTDQEALYSSNKTQSHMRTMLAPQSHYTRHGKIYQFQFPWTSCSTKSPRGWRDEDQPFWFDLPWKKRGYLLDPQIGMPGELCILSANSTSQGISLVILSRLSHRDKEVDQPEPAMQKINPPKPAWSLVQTSVDGLCSLGF